METIDYKNFLGIANINNGKNQIKARVLDVDSNNSKALVETIDGSMRIKLNNKTGELLSVGDYVVVEYDKVLTKKNAYISLRNGQAVPIVTDGIQNAVIIQEKDVSHLLHEYTVVDYIAGNKIVYASPKNSIIVQGMVVYAYKSTSPNGVNINNGIGTLSQMPDIPLYNTITFNDTGVGVFDESKYIKGVFTKLLESNASYTIQRIAWSTIDLSGTEKSWGYTCNVYNNDYGVTFVWEKIFPPGTYETPNITKKYPYGYVTARLAARYKNSDVDRYQMLVDAYLCAIPFASEAEYNAAVGLTYEPMSLLQVNETISEV